MSRKNESLFEMLTQAPWWMSVIVACTVYIGMAFVLPGMLKGPMFTALAKVVSSWAKWVALFFLIPGAVSALLQWKRGELFKSQTSLSTIRNLSWRSLEVFVAEAYRRDGYRVEGNSGLGADGGVDVIARKGGETLLIQCKHWKARRVGVKTVREMFGILNAKHANEVHIVTSGTFTEDAIAFAQNKPIRLIDGFELVQLIQRIKSQNQKDVQISKKPAHNHSRVICPK
jgi:restriction system protein